MKIFTIFAAVSLLAAAAFLTAPVAATSALFRSANIVAAQESGTQARDADAGSPKTDQEAASKATARREAAQFAARLLERCRGDLSDQNISTYQTDIEERVRIGGREFTAKGKYYRGPNRQFRLELEMTFRGGKQDTKGRMLQVCDGDILMTEQVAGKWKRATRRDVRRILKEVADIPQISQGRVLAELGLGGLRGLLASLQTTMVFDSQKSVPTKTTPAVQIEGGWNSQYRSQWTNGGKRAWPAYVPQRVRVLVDGEYRLRRIDYLSYDPATKSYEPMVSLQFHNIQLNPQLDEKKLFRYVPRLTETPEDTTDSYIRQFRSSPKR